MFTWLRKLLSPKKHDFVPDKESEIQNETEEIEDPEIFVVPIEDFIDLHTFSPKETANVVKDYLVEAQAKGFEEVRIIHGRGKGVQRRIIQSILAKHPLVKSFSDAPAHRGGWGATIAQLKKDSS